jgi:saccharopine dehydrogenase (NAD+, L-lysine-forming)
MGVILMDQGKVTAKGVLPPEGCVDPNDFISLRKTMKPIKQKGKKKAIEVLYAERIDARGRVTKIDI